MVLAASSNRASPISVESLRSPLATSNFNANSTGDRVIPQTVTKTTTATPPTTSNLTLNYQRNYDPASRLPSTSGSPSKYYTPIKQLPLEKAQIMAGNENNIYGDCETTYDDLDYESANDTSFCDNTTTPTNNIGSSPINDTDKNSFRNSSKSPGTIATGASKQKVSSANAKQANNTIATSIQSSRQSTSTASSTTSISSLNMTSNKHHDEATSSGACGGNKIRRPNFIIINKSGRAGDRKTRNSVDGMKRDNNITCNIDVNKHQRALTRGGKQRASTSSCSSSDSYGSGYASGSGNSTDHDQKEKLKRDLLSSLHNNPIASDGIDHDEGDEGDEEELEDEEDVDEEMASRSIDDTDGNTVNRHDESKSVGTVSSRFEKRNSEAASRSRSTTITPTATNQQSNTMTQNKQPATPKDSSPTGSPYKSHQNHQNQQRRSRDRRSSTSSSTCSMDGKTMNENSDASGTKITSQHKTYLTTPNKSNIINNVTSVQKLTLTDPSIDSSHQQIAPTTTTTTTTTPSLSKQEPYYHTLFQWEQLVSKGVTRPLLINDLDFTDLRDEDDCDLLNGSQQHVNSHTWNSRTQTGEPLHIKIPAANQQQQDQLDSGTGSGPNSGSPRSGANKQSTPVSAPPPMPPPPMSPWFSTLTGSRPQSQLLLSPTPSFDTATYNREESPVDSTCSNYSRDSAFCNPQTSTPTQVQQDIASPSSANNRLSQQHHQFSTLQQQQPISSLRSASSMSSLLFGSNGKYGSKRKKTMKLFWKEVREDRSLLSKLTKKKTIWDEIKPVPIDTQKLEYLFESKAKDLSLSRSRNGLDALNQRKAKITVLDTKRSNAINIGMTKLPPMRTIKSAILKMDSDIMNREGIEKILTTMMPTEEEKSRIIEAQLANPETPLGTAEQFLLNLASISALEARLKLWAFQLDYAQIEKEVAEPLMDLKQAIEEIERSETFRLVLGTLLSIGNFLNSSNVKGFQIDYLEKVPEVKDTVHKHSLLHHLCVFMQERYEHTTSDLYSEFSAVNRASKIDYVEVGKSLKKMQQDCKASWDYLKIVAKHDGLANLMNTSNSASANLSSSSTSSTSNNSQVQPNGLDAAFLSSSPLKQQPTCGKLNNLSKLSMITTITSSDATTGKDQHQKQQLLQSASSEKNTNTTTSQQATSAAAPSSKQMKTKVNDFLTDCAERIMVLMVIHRRVMNRFQKLLVYLGCPSHQIKQTQPQQVLKVINEFALEYRTKRERVREMIAKRQQQQINQAYQNNNHHYLQNSSGSRWQLQRNRWAGSQQYLDANGSNQHLHRPSSIAFSTYNSSPLARHQLADPTCPNLSCCDTLHRTGPATSLNNANSIVHNGSNGRQGGQWATESPYGDYLYDDQASNYCQSRQQSVTPVPTDAKGTNFGSSVSLFDLQNQHQASSTNLNKTADNMNHNHHQQHLHKIDNNDPEQIAQRQKDEQLCRLLGVGKSFDGACSDLLKMSHWTTTSQRVLRHQPNSTNLQRRKQRAVSIDCSPRDDRSFSNDHHNNQFTPTTATAAPAADMRRQSWQNSKYAAQNSFSSSTGNNNSYLDDDLAQNSDEELMHCLVRHANQSARNSLGCGPGASGNGYATGSLSANSSYGLQPQRGKLVARDTNT